MELDQRFGDATTLQTYTPATLPVSTATQAALDLKADVWTEAATAYVEIGGNDTTGAVGRADKPYATIAAALEDNVGLAYLTLKIGVGTFVSPPGDVVGGYSSTSKMRDNLRIIGSGQPEFNTNDASTTALVGGTILQGPLIFQRNNITVKNLGVDCGSAVVAAQYAGVAQEALLAFNGGGTSGVVHDLAWPQRTNFTAENITCLASTPSAAVHAFAVEHVDGVFVRGIKTRFGTHGIVFKSTRVVASDLYSSAHGSNAGIIKSNAYSNGSYMVVDNWFMESMGVGTYNSGGLRIHSETAGMTSVRVSNVQARETTFGLLMSENSPGSYGIEDSTFDVVAWNPSTYTATVTGDRVEVRARSFSSGDGVIVSSAARQVVIRDMDIAGSGVAGLTVAGGTVTAISPRVQSAPTGFVQTGGYLNVIAPTIGTLVTTFSTGTVTTTQRIDAISNLTTNGLLSVGGSNGTLGIATAGTDYVTPASPSFTGTLLSSGMIKSTVAASSGIYGLAVESSSPRVALIESDGPANAKLWDVNLNGGVLTFRLLNDADSSAVNWLTVTRSGAAHVSTVFTGPVTLPVTTVTTINGNTITTGTGTLTLGAGKTLTASNTVTLTATDGSTLNIGTGGTLGTAAYTAATAYSPSLARTTGTTSFTATIGINTFTGSTESQTITLPAPTATSILVVKNQSSVSVTVASASGSQIFTSSAQASVTVLSGDSLVLYPDGTFWNQ